MATRGGAGGVPQSGAMAPGEAVLLGLLLGVLGAAAGGECRGDGLPSAPGPAAPRSGAAAAGPPPAVRGSRFAVGGSRFTAPSVPQSRTPCATS